MINKLLFAAGIAALAAGCATTDTGATAAASASATGQSASAGASAGGGFLNRDKEQEHAAYEAVVQKWVGHDVSEMRTAWGKAMGAQQAEGHKVWLVYFKEYNYGGDNWRVQREATDEYSAGAGTALDTTERIDGYQSRVRQTDRRCLTRFLLTNEGKIEDVKVDGECREGDLSDGQRVG